MKGWTVKKIILRCFFRIGLFCLHTKFQVSQSSPSGFLSKNAIFFILFAEKIFFLKNIYGFTPVKKRIIRFGPKMSKSKAITFKDLFNSLLLSIAAQCIVLGPDIQHFEKHTNQTSDDKKSKQPLSNAEDDLRGKLDQI